MGNQRTAWGGAEGTQKVAIIDENGSGTDAIVGSYAMEDYACSKTIFASI